jgi:hypothetical protein
VLALRPAIVDAAIMFHAFMLCYVHAEARRLRLRAWVWFSLVLVLNLPGIFVFLVRSGTSTG